MFYNIDEIYHCSLDIIENNIILEYFNISIYF